MSSRLHLQNYFAVPNSLVDDAIMHQLSLAEVRTLLYILRHTYGFQKTQDAISQSQFLNGVASLDLGTGLSRNSLRNALRCLEQKGCLRRIRQRSPSGRDLPTVYLPLLPPEGGQSLDPSPAQGGHPLHRGGGNKPTPSKGAKFCTSQKKEIHRYTKGGSTLPLAASARAQGAAEPPSPGEVEKTHLPPPNELPASFQDEALKERWERIFAWWNSRWPLDQCSPHERRLAYREMERRVRDRGFEPTPPGWRPPTFEEALDKMGIEPPPSPPEQ